MAKHQNGEVSSHVEENGDSNGVILGVDGGTTSTICVCMPFFGFETENGNENENSLSILSRAVSGCSNHNSVGEATARDTLEHVIEEALSKACSTREAVKAVCLAISGVNHPSDQERIQKWIRQMFSGNVKLDVYNDAVAALASGTMGKLHGCVLISGTGSISYGITEDGKEARAGGGGPVLGDWGSGYGIAAQALTAVFKAHDGRGPKTMLTDSILHTLGLSSPDEVIGWTYADTSWARIAALVPAVVSCAEVGDDTANKILLEAVEDLAACVKSVVQRLHLCGHDKNRPFPVVLVGGVLEANKKWDLATKIIDCIRREFPGAYPIRPKVEPAVGAALLACNLLGQESSKENGVQS